MRDHAALKHEHNATVAGPGAPMGIFIATEIPSRKWQVEMEAGGCFFLDTLDHGRGLLSKVSPVHRVMLDLEILLRHATATVSIGKSSWTALLSAARPRLSPDAAAAAAGGPCAVLKWPESTREECAVHLAIGNRTGSPGS